MTGLIAAEVLKLRTTRTVPVLLAAAVALVVFGVSVDLLSRTAGEVAQEDVQREVLSGGTTVGVFVATLAGLLAVTNEFRYGTIRPTLLVEPRRRVVLAAKLAAAALAGVALAVACVAVSFGAGLAILTVRGADVELTGGHALTLVAGPVGAATLSAMAGVAVGALIRNQAGAIAALAGYALAIDAVLFQAVPEAGRYLPGKAGDALAGRPDELMLAPALGAAVLAVWVVAFVAAAIVRTERTDV